MNGSCSWGLILILAPSGNVPNKPQDSLSCCLTAREEVLFTPEDLTLRVPNLGHHPKYWVPFARKPSLLFKDDPRKIRVHCQPAGENAAEKNKVMRHFWG